VGDQIEKGDVVATIDQPELLQQIDVAEAALNELV
jgi:multidrug efflux pump subunit AcrA (membrane-fusion protein)